MHAHCAWLYFIRHIDCILFDTKLLKYSKRFYSYPWTFCSDCHQCLQLMLKYFSVFETFPKQNWEKSNKMYALQNLYSRCAHNQICWRFNCYTSVRYSLWHFVAHLIYCKCSLLTAHPFRWSVASFTVIIGDGRGGNTSIDMLVVQRDWRTLTYRFVHNQFLNFDHR